MHRPPVCVAVDLRGAVAGVVAAEGVAGGHFAGGVYEYTSSRVVLCREMNRSAPTENGEVKGK